jgi:hypothetical protein
VSDDSITFSPEASALLLAMTALQTAHGVDPATAFARARAEWQAHTSQKSWNWDPPDLEALVLRLGPGPSQG